MEETIDNPVKEQYGWTNYLILGGIALVLILAMVFAYQVWTNQQLSIASPDSEGISQVELEARYGLQVRLIGVTAGGGMVDFRLKMSDPDKAREFFENPTHLPVLMVAEDGTELLAADEMEDDITWEEGGILFILLSNRGGVVQPGTPVTISFGDIQLEPILAQ
jgi:hypothetical protein